MSDLKSISDENLWSQTYQLASKERIVGLDVIRHMREINQRGLHLKRGYSSLYTFAIEHLKYSEGSAARRIAAMKLLDAVPELEKKISGGIISVTSVAQAQTLFQAEARAKKPLSANEKVNFLQKLEGKSKREVEREIAIINPVVYTVEKVREVSDTKTELKLVLDRKLIENLNKLRHIRAHTNTNMSYQDLLQQLVELGLDKWDESRKHEKRMAKKTNFAIQELKLQTPKATSESTSKVSSKVTSKAPSRATFKATSEGTSKATSKEALKETLEATLKQASVQKPESPTESKSYSASANWSEVASVTTVNARPEGISVEVLISSELPPPVAVKSRYINAATKSKVFFRDQAKCQYVDPVSNKRCCSSYLLQIDHCEPFALGGSNDIKNLRLLCAAHNRLRAESTFGRNYRSSDTSMESLEYCIQSTHFSISRFLKLLIVLTQLLAGYGFFLIETFEI